MTDNREYANLTKAQIRKMNELRNGQPAEYAWGQSGLFLIERGFAFENELGARHLTDKGHKALAALEGVGG